MPKQMVATEDFLAVVNGYTDRFIKGETIVDEDNEAVKQYPDRFERVRSQRPEVEQATQAPGEQRGDVNIGGARAEAKSK